MIKLAVATNRWLAWLSVAVEGSMHCRHINKNGTRLKSINISCSLYIISGRCQNSKVSVRGREGNRTHAHIPS